MPYRKGHKCPYCGINLLEEYVEEDHKIPLSRGGSNLQSNIQLTCRDCNRRKGEMTDEDFRKKYHFYGVPLKPDTPPKEPIPQEYFQIDDREAKLFGRNPNY